ncbi:VCBS repeat-containing protein [Flectobacillus roseus]|uniref:VCBS repeat-containing protein n=1 Tax=Flectobacillus roseus TaxID=502259 RepID=A0ABT6Y669_9BACT|nr:VCBS repeat-containing protein [Flectobacillus roseus]MDI9858583.1 VCBS repeat-containing protein [Flectobacillus roseus]
MKVLQKLSLIALMGIGLGCSSKSDTVFELMDSKDTGIDFVNKVENSKDFNIFNYRNFYNGGGVAIGDINNDGLPDIFLTSNMGANKLYLNKGDWKFEDISKKAGVEEIGKWNTGVVMVDINHDGLLDIYVCNAGINKFTQKQKNALFINNGNSTFTESAAKYGLDEGGYTTHAAFFDYDLDGDLDCYILNNSFIPVNTLNYANNRELRAEDWPVKDFLKGGGDKLMRNDNGFFHDVSKDAGIYSSLIGFGLGVTIGDANNDNYPDIYVSNDFYEKDYLYINQKDGTFKEEIEQRMKHISLASMGADMADINNDGYQEIITTDMLPRDEYRLKTTSSFDNHYVFKLKKERGFYNQFQQNSLQLNNQDGTFSEIGNYAGVAASDWSWGALMFDADNDGYNDIYVCNGIYNDVIDQDFIDFFANELVQDMRMTGVKQDFNKIIEKMPSTPIPNNFFHNTKSLKFEEKAKDFGFDAPSFSNGAMYADLDNDGDEDLVVNNVNAQCFVYRNNSDKQAEKPHFLKVKLQGEGQNTYAVGAKVDVFTGKETQTRSLIPSRGFQSSAEYVLNFGLGKNTKIDSLIITWPDQRISIYKNPKIDGLVSYQMKDGKKMSYPKAKLVDGYFQWVNQPFEKHQEDPYEDFYQEKNLPAMLSKEGPKAAVGDVNGDGLEDIYIAGAKDQAGMLYLQTAAGFKLSKQESFERTAFFEDTAVLFFDADKDGDLDLFVGSGGNEVSEGTNDLLDRLYLNDGKGKFTYSSGAIPMNTLNTSVVLPLDYDADGDIDLFVGSRSVPMQYGLNPNSFIYQNDGKGAFKDVTASVAPQLKELGMVRDASLSDVNKDGTKDLVIVGDWMAPVTLLAKGAKFEKADNGLEEYTGFWGAIKVLDVDGDGDNDMVLGNMGENFTLHTQLDAPLKIWVKDFDKNGSIDKILTKTINEKDSPVFLKREMAEQFPALKKQILQHAEYAKKSLQDLFPSDVLEGGLTKTVGYCKSIVAINDGKGKFTVAALPEVAQLSCINAIEQADVNHDGKPDLIIGGNYTGFIPQLAMIDASRGNVLINKGKGQFEVLTNQESGFVLNGEIKQILPVKVKTQTEYLALINNEVPRLFALKK